MADIARETGLTLGTVSRALNTEGKYAVSTETKERVMEVAARLGYRPNLIGKALAARSTGLILFVSPDPFAPYYVQISRHLSDDAGKQGYSFVASGSLPEGGTLSPTNWLYGVDGMVVCDCLPWQEAYVAEALRLKIPIVGLGVRDPFPTDFVKVDLYPAAVELMAHLSSKGCRQIAMADSPEIDPYDPRRRAYREAVARSGFEEIFITAQDQSREAARRAIKSALSTQSFDALFCENDLMAVGAYRGLLDLGLAVPRDIRLAGCDGLEDARFQAVPITTIAQPLESMCEAAWRLLQSRIEGEDGPLRVELYGAQLEIRESTQ